MNKYPWIKILHGGILHWAVDEGDMDMAKALIEGGISVNARDEYGDRPLHHSVRRKYKEMTIMLINMGAKIDAEGRYGRTPLRILVYGSNLQMVKLLLENGANPNYDSHGEGSPYCETAVREHNESAFIMLQYGARIECDTVLQESAFRPYYIYCFHNKNVEDIKSILDVNPDMATIKNPYKETPLHALAMAPLEKADNFEMAKLLISYGAEVNSTEQCHQSPLAFSLLRGNGKLSEYFLENGANISLADRDGKVIIKQKLSAANIDTSSYQEPSSNKDIEKPLADREQALINLLEFPGSTVAIDALNSYPDLVNFRGDYNLGGFIMKSATPLHYISYLGDIEGILLLYHRGADLKALCSVGTPLHVAAIQGRYKAVDLLISLGASFMRENDDGFTPRELAMLRYAWLSRNSHTFERYNLKSMAASCEPLKAPPPFQLYEEAHDVLEVINYFFDIEDPTVRWSQDLNFDIQIIPFWLRSEF